VVTAPDIGSGGRLQPGEEAPERKGSPLRWPKGMVPFPHVKEVPKGPRSGRIWREIPSILGQIMGIGAISAGFGWYSPGLGLISGGVGIFAISFVAAMPPRSRKPDKR
jgi:hypothetical protein